MQSISSFAYGHENFYHGLMLGIYAVMNNSYRVTSNRESGEGRYDIQTEMEKEITSRINQSNIGALGLHGDTSVLATFMKTGPQRASGVRIVCMRPCCCFEPRVASVVLPERNITVL